jgi:dimethylglycine dehydrogenase
VVRDEVAAVHGRVGVLDLTGFAKYDISGPGAQAFLNRICANQVPRQVGGIALVHLLSPGGRIQGEMTLSKLADDKFYALSAAAAELRDLDHLTLSVEAGEPVRIENVTEEYGVLVVSGPRSRELLSRLTDEDLGNDGFRWLRAREIQIAGLTVRALRVSYIGELGWELHVPIGFLASLYEAIWKAGQEFGIVNYGLYAVNSMRMEKAYKAWSTELTNELNMLEADMSRFIRFDKGDFVGKAATLARAPRPFKIVYVDIDATDTDARGGEPIFSGSRCIGVTTSGAYGHRVGKSLAFACVDPEYAAPGSVFEVLLQGERRAASVLDAAAFDPDNLRMRA